MRGTSKLWEWIFLVAVWVVVASWVSFFEVTNSRFLLEKLEISSGKIADPYLRYLVMGPIFTEGLLFGLLFGTTFFVINRLTDQPQFNRQTVGLIIGVRSLLYVLGYVLVSWLSAWVLQIFEIVPLGYFQWTHNQGFSWSHLYSIGGLILVTIILLNISFQVGKKYGQFNLLPIFLGKYQKPQVERRIFLFLDLKSSTTFAEKLGHLSFSRLIQVIFSQVNQIAPAYQGQIYNYVGDEVIITWPEDSGLRNANCIRLVFHFLDNIKLMEQYFEDEFGLTPEFKAGLHGGDVTVAEVGIIKRDISFFGDVVNTASRLQALCKDYSKTFLTSEYIYQRLKDQPEFTFEAIGKVALRGKEKATEIYAIQQSDPGPPET